MSPYKPIDQISSPSHCLSRGYVNGSREQYSEMENGSTDFFKISTSLPNGRPVYKARVAKSELDRSPFVTPWDKIIAQISPSA